MKIHKRIHEEGTCSILTALAAVSLIVAVVCWFWPRQTLFHLVFYVLCLLVIVLVVRFFRVPSSRKTTIEEDAVLSPADGVVAANEVVWEDEYFRAERRQISIFMSIYNVHVNFFPINGSVSYYKYHPGKFLVAFNPKSSSDNEHNTIVMRDEKGREIMMRQIAGFVARRIVCDLNVGDDAVAGEEFGMIRFGSRVDIFLPLDAEVRIKIGDKTVGRETVLAKLY